VLIVKALANMIGDVCRAAVLAQGGDHKVTSRALWPESVRAVSVGPAEICARRLPTRWTTPAAGSHCHVTSPHAAHLVLATHSRFPAAAEGPNPPTHGLPSHPHASGHPGQIQPLPHQPQGLQAALFQAREITPHSRSVTHIVLKPPPPQKCPCIIRIPITYLPRPSTQRARPYVTSLAT